MFAYPLSATGLIVPIASIAAVAVLAALGWRRLARRGGATVSRRRRVRDTLDTVAAWQPEAARVLTLDELQALELARRAAPGALLLSQVPLSRFLRVPTRHSYGRWLARVGNLNADLLVCDAQARVIAVVDVRVAEASERSRRRHERMLKVLRAAGLNVIVWQQNRLPSVATARAQLTALGVPVPREAASGEAVKSPPAATLEPPELTAVLEEGDKRARKPPLPEPVLSDFYGLSTAPMPFNLR